jgi:hypothetical protein
MPHRKAKRPPWRPKKKGLKVKDKLLVKGARVNVHKVGLITGAVQLADRLGVPINCAELGRSKGLKMVRGTVALIAKRVRAGELDEGPPTQAHKDPNVARKVVERRVAVEKAALRRVQAEDGTPRAAHPTLEAIRCTLPVAKRPRSRSTVFRDLRAQGVAARACVVEGEAGLREARIKAVP